MTQNPYDQVPYGHRPHPQTHPDHLCSIGRLFGLPATDPRAARVLELGCASGGNLIPMACGLPDARFFGIDASGEQIRDGRQRVADLGLENIELAHQSILDLEKDGEPFDYILCHGVYSWVDDETRESILEVCRERLAEDGVAQVSINTLPGWNMVKSIRDLMLFHTRSFEDPGERAAQARALVEWAGAATRGDQTPYSLLLQRELELLSEVDDSYLIHDHLSEFNRPQYFSEFMAEARRHELAFLADAQLATMLPENLPDAVAGKLREIGDLERTEQYLDFLVGRRFRNILLCRTGAALRRDLSIESLRGFWISTPCLFEGRLEPHHLEDGVEVTFVQGQTRIALKGRLGKIAISILAAEKGRPMPFEALLERVAVRAQARPEDMAERLESELLPVRLLFANALAIHSAPPSFTVAIEERPSTSRLAAYQAGRDAAVTNQRHEPVRLGPAERLIVEHLDGSRSVTELVSIVEDAVASGRLDLTIEGLGEGERLNAAEAREAIAEYCSLTLEKLAGNALLVSLPASPGSGEPRS